MGRNSDNPLLVGLGFVFMAAIGTGFITGEWFPLVALFICIFIIAFFRELLRGKSK